MIVSQSELFAMVRKAGVGSGLSAGVAIDLARSAVWLCSHGFDGIANALAALDGDPEPTLCRSESGDLTWVAQGARLAVDARAGLDLLSAGTAESVVFENPDSPLIVLGAAAVVSKEQGHAFWITWDGSASCVAAGGAVQGEVQPAASKVRVEAVGPEPAPDAEKIEAVAEIEVTAKAWGAAGALAALTYVPSTEASRTGGAGAGLTDND